MRNVSRTTAVLVAIFLAVQAYAQDSYPPNIPDARIETYRSVNGVDLKVWIFEPEGHIASRQTPAMVFFFGGGWTAGSPAQFQSQAKHLASRGMIAVLADYRVLSRNGTTVGSAVQDAKDAMRWVRANAGRLGVDPSRIAAGGGSSGGHLAAATAILPGYDDPNADLSISAVPDALVLFNPAVVLAPVAGHPDTVNWLPAALLPALGKDDAESLSPYHHIRPELPPTIIFHGKADSTVPYSHVELFTEAMKAAGNRCELVGYPGQKHGFFNPGRGDGTAYTDTVERMDAFLVSLGWLSEP